MKLRGLALAIVVVALAESMDYMMSATPMHTPPFMVARYLVKICVALAIFAQPAVLRSLLARKQFCIFLAISGCAGSILLFAAPTAAVVMVSTVLVTMSEVCLFVGQVLVVFSVAREEILKAAMAGVLAAFGVTVVAFSLPALLALTMQLVAICLLSFFVQRDCRACRLQTAAASSKYAPVLPWSLVAVLVLFSFGTQFAFIFGDIDCDWAMVYALGVLAGAGIMVLEFRAFPSSRISTLDIVCALFIAVPVMLVGVGHLANGLLMALVNVGNCLFLPRMLQVIFQTSEEDGVDVVRGASLAYVVITVSVMLATLAGIAILHEPVLGSGKTAVSIVIAVGCIFSAFILYAARVRDDTFEYIRTNERVEESSEGRRGTQSSCASISPDDFRRVAEELYLTRREAEVLVFLVEGNELEEVGDKLCIAMSTVKTHVLHIYQKFGVHSRRELVEAVTRRSVDKEREV